MKQHLTAVFLLAIILLQSCCKKNEPAPDPYHDYKMPHEMLDYGYFKPGTYWVYQDSVSGAIDSVWVFDCNYGIDTLSKDNSYGLPQGVYDYFKTKTRSSYFNADYYYWSNSSWTSKLNGYKSILWREKITVGSSVVQTIVMTNKFVPKDKTYPYTQDGVVTFITRLETFQSFSQVCVFNDSKNITEDNSNSNFYIVKNGGIVRKEILYTNYTWKLIKYQIQQ